MTPDSQVLCTHCLALSTSIHTILMPRCSGYSWSALEDMHVLTVKHRKGCQKQLEGLSKAYFAADGGLRRSVESPIQRATRAILIELWVPEGSSRCGSAHSAGLALSAVRYFVWCGLSAQSPGFSCGQPSWQKSPRRPQKKTPPSHPHPGAPPQI